MFSGHFQNIFSHYHLSESVVAARDACFRVVPHKVLIGDRDRLERDFMKDEFFVALSSMQNGKSSGIDGLPCEFYKEMWDIVGDDFCNLAHEVFSIGCLSESLNQGLIKLIPKNTSLEILLVGGNR
jgi:hypothetical protein